VISVPLYSLSMCVLSRKELKYAAFIAPIPTIYSDLSPLIIWCVWIWWSQTWSGPPPSVGLLDAKDAAQYLPHRACPSTIDTRTTAVLTPHNSSAVMSTPTYCLARVVVLASYAKLLASRPTFALATLIASSSDPMTRRNPNTSHHYFHAHHLAER